MRIMMSVSLTTDSEHRVFFFFLMDLKQTGTGAEMIPFVNKIDWLFLTFSPLSPSHFSRLSPLRRKCLVCVSVLWGGTTQTQMHICSITDLRLLPRRLSRPTHAVDLFVAFSYPCRNLCPIINSLSFLNLSERVRYKKHHLSLLYK